MPKINVLVVDDSAVIRKVVSEILTTDRSIIISAAVADPLFAMKRMNMQWPDVIVLDITSYGVIGASSVEYNSK